MLLELCKSAVHIMFSDMCPLEREREQGRKWGGAGRGRLGLGLRERGGWDGMRGRQGGGRQQSSAAQGLSIKGRRGGQVWFLHLLPIPLSGSKLFLPLPTHLYSVSSSVKWEWPKGQATHGSKTPDLAWSSEMAASQSWPSWQGDLL